MWIPSSRIFWNFPVPRSSRCSTSARRWVVDMTLQLLEHRLKSYDATAKVIREGSLPAVEADPEQLKEVLVNLIINACEAIGTGQNGRIVVHEGTGVEGAAGRMAVLRISDNGPGMSEDIRAEGVPALFSPPRMRAPAWASRSPRGSSGEHRGKIKVRSVEGEGHHLHHLPSGVRTGRSPGIDRKTNDADARQRPSPFTGRRRAASTEQEKDIEHRVSRRRR